MKIELNTELVESAKEQEYDLGRFLHRQLNPYRREKYTEQYMALDTIPFVNMTDTGLVGLLSNAYSAHRKVAIAPHDVWMTLISEIAISVKDSPSLYRDLFTDSDEKKELSVPSASMVVIPMDALSDVLSHNVKFDSSILFPVFSTSTSITDEMTQALFCDMASPYYDYSMFCCGIPEIKLLGSVDDWESLRTNWGLVADVFSVNKTMGEYFDRVRHILDQIMNTFTAPDGNVVFWKNIFTQKNIGSGGDLLIDGWITDLFVKSHSLNKIENFTSNMAIVKYKQKETNRNFAAVYGGFNYVRDADGFIQLEYAKCIFEKVPV